MLKIESVKVKVLIDEDPDFSFLGRYTDEPEDGAN